MPVSEKSSPNAWPGGGSLPPSGSFRPGEGGHLPRLPLPCSRTERPRAERVCHPADAGTSALPGRLHLLGEGRKGLGRVSRRCHCARQNPGQYTQAPRRISRRSHRCNFLRRSARRRPVRQRPGGKVPNTCRQHPPPRQPRAPRADVSCPFPMPLAAPGPPLHVRASGAVHPGRAGLAAANHQGRRQAARSRLLPFPPPV